MICNMKRYTSFKEVDAAIIMEIGSTDPTTKMTTLHLKGEKEGEVEHAAVGQEWLAKHSDNGDKNLVGGYFVKYADGYTSWSPAEAFESGYKEIEKAGTSAHAGLTNNPAMHAGRDFSWALEALKRGIKVGRREWKNARFVFLVDGSKFAVNRAPLNKFYKEGTEITYRPHIDMVGADDSVGTWAPSMVDLLTDDWVIVE